MPELPEVETTVKGLKKVLPGLEIRDVWSDWKKQIKNPKTFFAFKKAIVGKKIEDVERRGKNVLIILSGNKTLLVHMKMTGFLVYKKEQDARFIHFVLKLSNGYSLALSDLRKFAKILIWPTDKLTELPELQKLGPDALNKKLTLKKFKEVLLKKPNGKIKQVLMNQEIISGIGNIYSDEILWMSGILPTRPVKKISEPEFKKIYKNMREVLKKGIKFGGDSMSDYRNIKGKKGNFQKYHKAYRQEGNKCQRVNCKGVIKRIKIGGRSSCFCPSHQL